MLNFLKYASTYSYSASHSRDFIPKSPSIKPKVVLLETGVLTKKVKPKEFGSIDGYKQGTNKNSEDDAPRYMARHTNSISGSGSGRPYWNYSRNPYEF